VAETETDLLRTAAARTRFRAHAPIWYRHVGAISAALRRTSSEVA
jgi:hypothetical protein